MVSAVLFSLAPYLKISYAVCNEFELQSRCLHGLGNVAKNLFGYPVVNACASNIPKMGVEGGKEQALRVARSSNLLWQKKYESRGGPQHFFLSRQCTACGRN